MADGVAILGSGPAGVSAAWPLLAAGVAVTMLDAAPEVPPPAPPRGDLGGLRRDPEAWRVRFGADFCGLAAAGDRSPKLATPLARAVLDGFSAANGIAAEDFLALGSLGRGGLSAIWGALATEWGAEDFARFPFGPAALAPSYAAVAARIGVGAAPVAGAAARVLAAFGRRGGDGVALRAAPNAVRGCVRCGLCLWGCAHGAIHDSGAEVAALRRFPHFSYLPGHVVTDVAPDGAGHVLIAGETRVRARRVVLAAGTLATTALVLRRLGQVGTPVRLLHNPVGAMAFLLPGLIGAPLAEGGFALAQLAYDLTLRDGARAAGALYGADTLPLADLARRMPLTRPAALRLARALAPALLPATLYLAGDDSAAAMVLRGDGSVAVTGGNPPRALAALRDAAGRLGRAMRRLGAVALPGAFSPGAAGSDAHYAGTLPMGGAGPLGSAADGELRGCPGLHVADGAALPALAARHCTLTIMANADRIGRLLAARG